MSRVSYRAPYWLAALLAGLYLSLVYTICAAGATLQVDWSFTSKFFLIGGIFIFASVANLIVMGNSARESYLNAERKKRRETEFAAELKDMKREVEKLDWFLDGFQAGVSFAGVIRDMHPAPTPRRDWRPIIAAIIGFAIGSTIAKRLLND